MKPAVRRGGRALTDALTGAGETLAAGRLCDRYGLVFRAPAQCERWPLLWRRLAPRSRLEACGSMGGTRFVRRFSCEPCARFAAEEPIRSLRRRGQMGAPDAAPADPLRMKAVPAAGPGGVRTASR